MSKAEHVSDFTENQLDWILKLQDSYEKGGYLSMREVEILDDLWRKAL